MSLKKLQTKSSKIKVNICSLKTPSISCLAEIYSLDKYPDMLFIVTKKDIWGKSSKFLMAYEFRTGNFLCSGKDIEELDVILNSLLEKSYNRIVELIDNYLNEGKQSNFVSILTEKKEENGTI